MRVRSTVILATVGPLLICAISKASTINVPAQQPTIQSGIDAAVDGDTVLVAPGTYVESIDFSGKAITVRSSAGPAKTIIDGRNAQAPVVRFGSGETNNSVIAGFTIENGNSGGVSINFASPVVQGNLIRNNASGEGGGLSVTGSSTARILRNVLTGNTGFSAGGAIALFAAGAVVIANNRIYKNNGGSSGGAIWIVNEADEIIVQNLMYGNVALSGTEINSSIPQSTTGFRLINNTIVSTNANADAAVVADGFNTNVELINNVIIAPSNETALLCNPNFNGGPPVVQLNDVLSGTGTSYGGSCTGFAGTHGNISANPDFVGKTNFQLQNASPAINAGTNSAPDIPARDFASKPRIVGGTIDMGAYENQSGMGDRIEP